MSKKKGLTEKQQKAIDKELANAGFEDPDFGNPDKNTKNYLEQMRKKRKNRNKSN